ncbi:1369_t:CDS:2 [Funneliformis geosporum]|uniref:1369_t:CDS:1 n=1 Tax=Funneliformis geosporum TaxID=1117311 RepID=A0A9W4X3C9_9GLOM|nr:1369_t:CDS:2 [Funneliformis geosporum]
MKYVDSWRLCDCDDLKNSECKKIINDIEVAVNNLYAKDIVFADLRNSNILVIKDDDEKYSKYSIKEFTLASCGHIFYQKCLEKHLVNGEAICLNKECNKVIGTFLSLGLEKNKDKEIGLQESTRSSADETNTTTTDLTNSIATTATMANK